MKKQKKDIFALLADWHPEIDESIQRSNSFCFALFSTSGKLIFCNQAFESLLKENDPVKSFINPTFDKLIKTESTSTLIFDGFITLGDYDAINSSILAQVYRKEDQLLVIGGIDPFKLLDQNKQLAALNREINNLQREVLKKAHTLENTFEELNAANVKLKNEKTTRDKLFSIIAHDLRSPFNSIIGFSDMLVENFEQMDPQEVKKYLRLVITSAQKTMGLLENLLHWSKAQTGQIGFKPTRIRLAHALQEIIDTSSPLATMKNIELKSEIDGHLELFVDLNMFKAIFRNLISNAVKFTPANGRIVITGTQNNDVVRISVTDNGVGMDDETKKNLFQLDDTVIKRGTEGEMGSGLGLLLCKEFVAMHQGKISVESQPGKGTTFHVEMGKTESAPSSPSHTKQ